MCNLTHTHTHTHGHTVCVSIESRQKSIWTPIPQGLDALFRLSITSKVFSNSINIYGIAERKGKERKAGRRGEERRGARECGESAG